MKIAAFRKSITILILTSFSMAGAVEKTNCPLKVVDPTPPTVIIYPDSGIDSGEVRVEFKVPSGIKGTPDKIRSLKFDDRDGSVSVMLSMYLLQNTPLNELPTNIEEHIIKALKKRQEFWEKELANSKATPPKPNLGVDPTLIENSLAANKYILQQVKSSLTAEMRKQIIKDALGTFTDYDQVLSYQYKEFINGKFVTQPQRRLVDIFPPEFYQAASSTSNNGIVKDMAAAGATSCDYKPVLGRMPKAGDVQSIQRPGQGQR